MSKEDNDDRAFAYPVDHNAHVYAWKQYVDEDFQRFLYRRGNRDHDDYRRSPKEWLQDKLFERRRRNEEIDKTIAGLEKRFATTVSEAKPFGDFIALLSLHSILSGLFFALIGELLTHGWSNRTALAALFACVYAFSMWRAYWRANEAFMDMAVLKVVRWLNLPNPPDIRWKSFIILWSTTFAFLHIGLVLGGSYVGYDLSKRIIEQVKSPPSVRHQTSPP